MGDALTSSRTGPVLREGADRFNDGDLRFPFGSRCAQHHLTEYTSHSGQPRKRVAGCLNEEALIDPRANEETTEKTPFGERVYEHTARSPCTLRHDHRDQLPNAVARYVDGAYVPHPRIPLEFSVGFLPGLS